MAESTAEIENRKTPVLLTLRLALSLAAATIGLGALSAWALATTDSGLPLAGVVSPSGLALWVAECALLVTIFIAPLVFEIQPDSTPRRWLLVRIAFAALWQAVTLAFFLMVASRVSPIDNARILMASAYLGCAALAMFLLAASLRRMFSAISFIWCVALPVGLYFLVEVFLFSPGGNKGFAQSSGPAAEGIRSLSRWVLSVSPPTALFGTLSGALPDGSDFSATLPFVSIALMSAILLSLIVRRGQNSASD